jgi:dUTP pyrophosphatase
MRKDTEMETLKYTKVRDVKSPCRAHSTDAGIDFFVPTSISPTDMVEKFKTTGCEVETEVDESTGFIKRFILRSGESVLIPSGIKVKVPDGYMLQFTNKSGIASKRSLLVGANVVDIGYEGECHINLHNVSDREQMINAGDKIVQGILVNIGFHQPEEVKDENELYGDERSSRGEGGFGSSGTK